MAKLPQTRFRRDLLPPADQIFRDNVRKFRRYGQRARGICPFHPKATHQSFAMDLARGLYHCHACGESGDLVRFVMMLDGVDFLEAASRLGALEPSDPSEVYRLQMMRQEKDQRAQEWIRWLRQQAAGMEILERVRDWAFPLRHDDIAELATTNLHIDGAEYILKKADYEKRR